MTDTRAEPDGFAEWLGRHCRLARVDEPADGTARRRLLARVYAAFAEAGFDVGVLARGLELGEPERAVCALWGVALGDLRQKDPLTEGGE